jgi:hypothetical protein
MTPAASMLPVSIPTSFMTYYVRLYPQYVHIGLLLAYSQLNISCCSACMHMCCCWSPNSAVPADAADQRVHLCCSALLQQLLLRTTINCSVFCPYLYPLMPQTSVSTSLMPTSCSSPVDTLWARSTRQLSVSSGICDSHARTTHT